MFQNYIFTEQAILFAVGIACVFITLATFLIRTLPIVRRRRTCDNIELEDSTFEDASIIVYSGDQCADLEELLPQLLQQDYKGRFEIIVVNDGDSLEVRDFINQLQIEHKNLYLTHTPDGARNLSRKKLAITLGIKASRHPVSVLTTASSRIESDKWLQSIMKHFKSDSPIEVVLGYASHDPYEDQQFGSRIRSFDFVVDAATWLGDAITGHPWRGTECNIAYRQDIFFRNKGFSRHLNLRHGDDDIFISEISNRHNTVVELSEGSIVRIAGSNSPRVARERLTQRRFTERFIAKRPRLLNMLIWSSYTIAFVAPIVAAALYPDKIIGWACCAIALIAWYATGLTWYKCMRVLNGRRLLLTLPFIALSRPCRQLLRSIIHRSRHSKRYTWE